MKLTDKKIKEVVDIIIDKYQNQVITFKLFELWFEIGQTEAIYRSQAKTRLNFKLNAKGYYLESVRGKGYMLKKLNSKVSKPLTNELRNKLGEEAKEKLNVSYKVNQGCENVEVGETQEQVPISIKKEFLKQSSFIVEEIMNVVEKDPTKIEHFNELIKPLGMKAVLRVELVKRDIPEGWL